MKFSISSATVFLGLWLVISFAAGERQGWGAPCTSSDDCISVLECQKNLFGNRCLCPGTLVVDTQSKGCRIEVGDVCGRDNNECVYNAECTQKIGESIKTCQRSQDMKNELRQSEPKNGLENFVEGVMKFFSGLF